MSVATTRWWWVRHAPIIAPPGTIAGRADLPCDLTDAAALDALADRLPRGAVWIATPLSRTRDTAAALLKRMGESAAVLTEPGLLEQDFGRWQGRTHAELAEEPGVHEFWDAPAVNAPPGGQSFAEMAIEVADTVERLSEVFSGRDVVSVGHAGPIRAAVGLALGLSPEKMLALAADCLHLSRLDRIGIDGGRAAWRVAGVNLPPWSGPSPALYAS